MPPSKALLFTAGLTVAFLLVFSVLRGWPDAAGDLLPPVGPSAAVAGLAMSAFDRWLWAAPGVQRFVRRPVLKGTWLGTIASEWVDPRTGERIPPDHSVFLVVRQTYWTISVHLYTAESQSSSVAVSLRQVQGIYELNYIYVNNPRLSVRSSSPRHFGTSVLNAPKDRKGSMSGFYFTDRTTRGEMRFSWQSSKLVDDHAAGQHLLAGLR